MAPGPKQVADRSWPGASAWPAAGRRCSAAPRALIQQPHRVARRRRRRRRRREANRAKVAYAEKRGN